MSEVEIGISQIEDLLPHRAPFLFVDSVLKLEEGKKILAKRKLRIDEPYFLGHFPGNPIMPGVLITEALAQTSGLLIALTALGQKRSIKDQILYLAKADMKWVKTVHPEETLLLESKQVRILGSFAAFDVRAFTARDDIARGRLTLAIGNSEH